MNIPTSVMLNLFLKLIKSPLTFVMVSVAAALVVFTAGCELKRPAFGMIDQIIVLADDEDWNYAEGAIKAVYERIIETPQFEKRFTVAHPPLESYGFYQKYHLIILLGTLGSRGIVGEILNQNITADNRASVAAGTKFAFQQRDVWAGNQYVLILIAPTVEDLLDKINANRDMLFQLVDKTANEFLKREMYKRKEQVELSKQLFETYGYTFRVQHDYFMKEWPEHNTIFLRRLAPDRMMVIHWVDTTDIGYIPESWVIQKRNELGEMLLDGRVLQEETVSFSRTEFADYTAVVSHGLWLHPVKFIGSPMINYTFYDELTKRIYMIDLSLFAPEYVGEKVPFLKQLDIMANTFSTNPRNLTW